MKIETERLLLREMNQEDYLALCKILQDKNVMYAYDGPFSDEEVQQWLDNQKERYRRNEFGLLALVLKETNEMIGQCGLTWQEYKSEQVLEIGYLLRKEFWGNGYATEAAKACKEYAFQTLKVNEVFSIIRDTNSASQQVAIRNGMKVKDTFVKHYRGIDMPHLLFSVTAIDDN